MNLRISGKDKVVDRLRTMQRRFEQVSTPEGAAKVLTEKHAALVCPEHKQSPKYQVKVGRAGLGRHLLL